MINPSHTLIRSSRSVPEMMKMMFTCTEASSVPIRCRLNPAYFRIHFFYKRHGSSVFQSLKKSEQIITTMASILAVISLKDGSIHITQVLVYAKVMQNGIRDPLALIDATETRCNATRLNDAPRDYPSTLKPEA